MIFFSNDAAYEVIQKNKLYMRLGKNVHCFKITLNQPIALGDVISYSTTDSYELCFSTTSTRPESSTPATSSHTYTVADGDGLVGATTLYLWRANTSTTNINDFKIVRDNTTAVENVKASVNANVEAAKKVVIDGKLVIVKAGKLFNAAGAQVK